MTNICELDRGHFVPTHADYCAVLKQSSLKTWVKTSSLLNTNFRSPSTSWLSTPQQQGGSGAGSIWNNRKMYPQDWTNEMSDPDWRVHRKGPRVTSGLMKQCQSLTLGILPEVTNIAKTVHPVRSLWYYPLIYPRMQAPMSAHSTSPTKQLSRREQTKNLLRRL